MKKYIAVFFLGFLLITKPAETVSATEIIPSPPASASQATINETNTGGPEALARRGGGAYRSPRGTYNGGTRTGVTPTRPADRTRTTPDTATPGGRAGAGFGGLFGGFAMGALLGSLINPFGFGGGGFSFMGLLFWGVILFLAFRLFNRLRQNRNRW